MPSKKKMQQKDLRETVFVRHPVTPEQKRKFVLAGARIVDARFAPEGAEIVDADGKAEKASKSAKSDK